MSTSKTLIILIHGYGSTAKQMRGLFASSFSADEGYELVSLEAPHTCDLFPDRKQWFRLSYLESYLKCEIDLAAQYLEKEIQQFVNQLAYTGLPYVIVGHSQGAMIATRLALRGQLRPQQVLAIALSGPFVIDKLELSQITEISVIHGARDTVMPLEKTRQDLTFLKEKNIRIDLQVLDTMSHEIDAETLSCCKKRIEIFQNQ